MNSFGASDSPLILKRQGESAGGNPRDRRQQANSLRSPQAGSVRSSD